jgi:protein RecA
MATTKRKVVASEAPVVARRDRVKEKTQEEAKTKPRARIKVSDDEVQPASSYFADVSQKSGLSFVRSGSAVMDSALGGGWVLGRVANIVGDRSSGKTLLAIEACANFHASYPKGKIRYAESESAFDESYAEALGMPVDAVDFGKDKPMRTVEDWYNDVVDFLDAREKDRCQGLYILDSFDALSDDAEMGREIDKGSFGAAKAKKSGELFRKLVDRIEKLDVLLIVVSQIRDKLNVTFGETKTRSGGKALDFYASHIVWLAEIGKIKKVMGGVERVIGVNVKVNVKKNKVGLPFRTCAYPIIFGYGVDDLTANVEWLLEVGRDEMLKEAVGMSKAGYKVRIANLRDKGGDEVREIRKKLNDLVKREWQIIEQGFLPRSRKY